MTGDQLGPTGDAVKVANNMSTIFTILIVPPPAGEIPPAPVNFNPGNVLVIAPCRIEILGYRVNGI